MLNPYFPKRGKSTDTDKGSGKALNDSIWATVISIVKAFGVTEKYALYEISFTNALMYCRAIPMPGDIKGDTDNAPIYDDTMDACNPDNFKDEFIDEDEIIIRKQ